MKSLADALPPEIARQIHPDWRKNEAAYWAVRDQLLKQYQGQWIGFADGAVVAAGTSPVAVFLDGQEYPCRLHADFTGHERILGRDVLNRLEMLFRGPAGELVVNP